MPNAKTSRGLLADLRALKGKLGLVDTTAQGWDPGAGNAPAMEWTRGRLGAAPPEFR